MRIFLITKGCSKKKMRHPIFLNKGVGLRDESATFLHNFACSYLYVICKSLTICVFAGLTRKLILCFSNATRCVPTLFIDRNAGSAQRKKCTKIPGLFHGDCSTKVNVFVEQSGLRESPYFPPFPASLQRSLPAKQEQLFITYY